MFESDTDDGYGGVDARKAVREERLFRGDDFGVRSVFVRWETERVCRSSNPKGW